MRFRVTKWQGYVFVVAVAFGRDQSATGGPLGRYEFRLVRRMTAVEPPRGWSAQWLNWGRLGGPLVWQVPRPRRLKRQAA